MLKLKNYFKKFWAPILLCVGLLFLQSQSELALPDYMSDIVSVGIQAGGFDSAVSDVLSEDTYNHLLVLIDKDDQDFFKQSYKLVDSKDIDKDTLDKFPNAKGQNIYTLKDLNDKNMDELEQVLEKPMLLVTLVFGLIKPCSSSIFIPSKNSSIVYLSKVTPNILAAYMASFILNILSPIYYMLFF